MQLTFNPTITAGAYTSGMCVGGKLSLPKLGPATGRVAVVDVVLIDKSAQPGSYELHFFDDDLVGAVTDHVAYAVVALDLPKSQGHLTIAGLASLGANGGEITLSNIYKRLTLPKGDAWAVLLTKGTPTYVGNKDLILKVTTELVGAV